MATNFFGVESMPFNMMDPSQQSLFLQQLQGGPGAQPTGPAPGVPAQPGIVPPSASAPMAGATPAPPPGMPAGTPPGTPPQQGGSMQELLSSPYASMISQGLHNVARASEGRPSLESGISAYQKNVAARALMAQKDEAARRVAMKDQRDEYFKTQNLKIAQESAAKPSAGQEKLNNYMAALGLDSSDPASMQDPRIANFLKTSGINIDLGNKEKDAWQEAMTSRSIDRYNTIQDGAMAADSKIQRFSHMRDLNSQFTEGGPLGPMLTDVKQITSQLGVDIPGMDENTTAQEVYAALATENQFNRTRDLKGSISEKELALAGAMDGSLSNTQEGRAYIIETRIAEARRAQLVAEAVDAYMDRSGAPFFDERAFRKSPEMEQVRSTPYATPELLSLATKVNPELGKTYRQDPATQIWYTRGPNGSSVAMFQ